MSKKSNFNRLIFALFMVVFMSLFKPVFKPKNAVNATIEAICYKSKVLNEVRIICANTDINKKKLGKYSICEADNTTNKTFTFCTKSAFSGVDFYSNRGLAIVVSEGRVKSTLLDISSDIKQIAGRIRTEDNPFKDTIIHIYSKSFTPEIELEDFEKLIEKKIRYADDSIKAFNDTAENLKYTYINRVKHDDPEEVIYYDKNEGKFKKDNLKINYLKYRYLVIDDTYRTSSSLKERYKREGYNIATVTEIEKELYRHIVYDENCFFEKYYKAYSAEKSKGKLMDKALVKTIAGKNKLVAEAYEILGDSSVEKLNYNVNSIKQWIDYKHSTTQSNLIKELINTFHIGKRYTYKEAKKLLGLCFEKLNIKITPKTSLLDDYFTLKRGIKIPKPNSNTRDEGIEILGIKNQKHHSFFMKLYNCIFKTYAS